MKFKVLLLLIFLQSNLFIYSQNKRIDSLLTLIKSDKADTSKVDHLNLLAWELRYSNPDTSILLSNRALDILNNSKNLPQLWKQIATGRSLHSLAAFQYLKGNYPKSLDFYFKALAIWDKLEDINHPNHKFQLLNFKSKTLGNIGVLYDEQGDYQKALDYYFKALNIDEKLVKKSGIATKLSNIGLVYKEQAGTIKNTIENAIKKDSLNQIALNYFIKALTINEELGDKNNMAICLGNIGVVYEEQSYYSKALEYYFKALKVDKELGNKNNIAQWLRNIGTIYTKQKKYTDAYDCLYKALVLFNSIGSINEIKLVYEYLSDLYEKSEIPLPDTIEGNLLNMEQMRLRSLYYYKRSIEIRDTLFSQENKKQLVQKEMNYEFEKKEAITKAENDKKIAIAAAENRKERIVIWFVVFGLLLVLAFAVFITRSLHVTRRQKRIIEEQKRRVDEAYEELNQQNDEIATQRDEIEAQRDKLYLQNKNITDSIEYARFIQQALLTSHEILDNCKIKNFILFKPRDIISGDFYWFKQIKNYLYFAAADCTGHGVPGAFMSVLGISLLNEIVSKRDLNPPAMVLNELRKKLKKSLKQDNPETASHDGIDIALCLFDLETKMLQFSGAFNPLFLVRNNELIEYSANHMPVGVHPKDNIDFTNKEIQLQSDDLLYIFSDGFISQFGGEKGKKFSIKQFKQLLVEINHQPQEIQKQLLEQRLIEWQQDFEQIDDILVIGITI
jgi:serine phosphatase RsbU (regulator of sigma subunit)